VFALGLGVLIAGVVGESRARRRKPDLFSQAWIEDGTPTYGVGGPHGTVEYRHGTGDLITFPNLSKARHLDLHVPEVRGLAAAGDTDAVYRVLMRWYQDVCVPEAAATTAPLGTAA
jgi:hypothetical protein